MTPANRVIIDGKDFWNVFGIIVESGTDGFLKYPAKKDSITHDWSDADGIDVDLSSIYFKSRDILLNCAIIAHTEEDFWKNYSAFIAQWAMPGSHRLEIAEFNNQSYYCFYQDTTNFKRYTGIKTNYGTIAAKFTLKVTEQNPNISRKNIYLVDHRGKFIIA